MNALLALLVVVAAANAAIIPAPAAISSGVTLKGPAARTLSLGPDGSAIDSAVDTGAVSSSMIAPAMAPAMIAAPEMIASRAYMAAPGWYGAPGLMAPTWNTLGRSLWW